MELIHAQQVSYEELLSDTIDIVIAACGYESRSCHLVQMAELKAHRRIALLFKEGNEIASRIENEKIFREHNFECYEISGHSSDELNKVLGNLNIHSRCENVKLVVDYSSMTKQWYGAIIGYFTVHDITCKNLVVYFCYTPENFVPPSALKPNDFSFKAHPIVSHENTRTAKKPVAMIVGLGYEQSKVEFLCDFFKPQDVVFFLPNPSFDDESTKVYRESNKKMLSKVNSKNVINYPANKVDEIDMQLRAMCLKLRLQYRVILVSLGPKTFSLASFLINARFPDVEIWNISGAEHQYDLKPCGMPIVYKAILSAEDDEY